MEAVIYLDTHVASWLYSARVDLFPKTVLKRIEASRLRISPAVHLELQYLFEIGRTRSPAKEVVDTLRREVDLRICELPFQNVVEVALVASWTRDPFDRLIASQATLREAPLLTKDRSIHAHCPWAVWGEAAAGIGEPKASSAVPKRTKGRGRAPK